ncbi:MAG TPA: hypothetical protein DC042_15470, partial [Bacteroidales bacterium]|nr:hypothetical protein [Bacteroidales bacterium]
EALSGQGAKYIIHNYDLIKEINLNGSTWSMIQDSNGILYFGADFGIATYNGSYWELASHEQSIVRSLQMDSHQRIFYGGFDDFGMLEKDISRGLIFKSLAQNLPDSLKNFGDIWSISKVGETLFFQAKTRIFILEGAQLRSLLVRDCYHRGFTACGTFIINQAGIGLSRYEGDRFIPVPGGEFFKDQIISCLFERPDRKVLIGTRYQGLFLLDPATSRIEDPFPGNPTTNRELSRSKIYHGERLPGGNLAVATLIGGTYILSPEGKILKILNRDHGLRDNVNYFLGVSSDANLWICTSNGISTFNSNSPFILWDYTAGIDGVVLDIAEYQDNIYAATLTGLYEISGSPYAWQLLQRGVRSILNTETWSLINFNANGRNLLLAGSGNGLYQYDGSEPTLIKGGGLVLKLKHLVSNPEYLLALHADNLDIFRWGGNSFEFLRNVRDLYTGLRTAGEDQEGNLWVGTRNLGIVRIPLDDLLFGDAKSEAITHDSILTDVIEFSGQVLFSNSKGLFTYHNIDRSFKKCQLFGADIISSRRMISTLSKDSRGNVWIGGENILMARPDGSFALDKLNFRQLKDVFSAFVFLHTPDQKTWIGGNNGVYLFDSRVSLTIPATLKTLINRIEVLQDTTLFLNAPSLLQLEPGRSKANSQVELVIDLNRRNSQVIISFSLPFFENEQETLYSYKLDGYDKNWSEWTAVRQVTFSNLKAGDYHFQVHGKNVYNQVGEPAEVRFTVPVPWYRTHKMVLAYLLVFACVVYLVASYFSRVSIRKHLRIEDIIRKRIQESNRAYIIDLLNEHPGHSSSRVENQDRPAGPESARFRTEGQDHEFLSKALKILEANISNPGYTAGLFCKDLGMSQAKAYRKLISSTGMSINHFIRNIRLKKAAQLLIETDLPISEIAYLTGFSSPGYFSKCFTADFGKTPRDFGHRKPVS